MVDVFRGREQLKIGLEKIDGRFVNIELDDHFVPLDLMMVRSGLPRLHLLAIDGWNKCHLDCAIDSTQDLISAVVMRIILPELSHGDFHRIKLTVLVVELRVDKVVLEHFCDTCRGISHRHAHSVVCHLAEEL